jgi:hypothetical protein
MHNAQPSVRSHEKGMPWIPVYRPSELLSFHGTADWEPIKTQPLYLFMELKNAPNRP